jgi:hypothetical protein
MHIDIHDSDPSTTRAFPQYLKFDRHLEPPYDGE